MFSGFMVIPYIAPTRVANSGLTDHDLPYIYLVGGAVTLISRPWIGRLTDRHVHTKVLTWMIFASCGAILLMTQNLSVGLWWQLVIAALFFICVSGRFIPCSALITASCEARARGRVMAFNSAMQNMGSGLAALAAGAIMLKIPDGEILRYDWVGYISCGVALLAAWTGSKVKAVS
jgi:predicted MFS family arabinose efflux permease